MTGSTHEQGGSRAKTRGDELNLYSDREQNSHANLAQEEVGTFPLDITQLFILLTFQV